MNLPANACLLVLFRFFILNNRLCSMPAVVHCVFCIRCSNNNIIWHDKQFPIAFDSVTSNRNALFIILLFIIELHIYSYIHKYVINIICMGGTCIAMPCKQTFDSVMCRCAALIAIRRQIKQNTLHYSHSIFILIWWKW